MNALLATPPNVSENTDIWKRICSLDLGPIRYKLLFPEEGEGWVQEKVDRIEQEYRAFLFLNSYFKGKSIVPSVDIDTMWHTHILDTAKYREDCQSVFGFFLDHFPYFGLRGPDDAKALKEAGEETRKLMQEVFGIQLTGSGSICDGCSGGCGFEVADRTRPSA